jgi:F0F1-type ATP synthase delta subunit
MAELVTVARPYAEATFKAGLEANQLAEYANGVQMAAAIAQDSAMAALLHDAKARNVFVSCGYCDAGRRDHAGKNTFR